MGENIRILSFHGADGSGKSVLARKLSDTLEGESLVLGGSSYREWLTPKVAKETLGKNHAIGKDAIIHEEKQRLYEEIAVACYGYAGYLADNGISVIIDSDPVLKRLVWAVLENEPEFESYGSRFGQYVLGHVDAESFPSHIVGVNTEDAIGMSDLQNRLSKRGGNSDFDPSNIEEATVLVNATQAIWTELKAATKHSSAIEFFNRRLGDATLIAVRNPELSRDEIDDHLASVSKKIINAS